jgi:hypothetical protein
MKSSRGKSMGCCPPSSVASRGGSYRLGLNVPRKPPDTSRYSLFHFTSMGGRLVETLPNKAIALAVMAKAVLPGRYIVLKGEKWCNCSTCKVRERIVNG